MVATIEMLLLQEPTAYYSISDYNYGWSIETSECKIEMEQRKNEIMQHCYALTYLKEFDLDSKINVLAYYLWY